MKKIIYLIAIFIMTSATQAKEGVLIEILDGDTLHFKTENEVSRCKMAYINSPESNYNNKLQKDIHTCKNVSLTEMLNAGNSARRNAEKILEIGKTYSYSIDNNDADEQICEVALGNGITYSEQMLIDGYAVLWEVFKNKQDEQNFKSLLLHAKNKNNGLWGNISNQGQAIKCLDEIRNNTKETSNYNYNSK
ncbi:MAG: thermonuclease family protein [Sulfurimonas sp.]|nr:thermonuclease family protein [Sulfurimonas sp.]